MQGIGMQSQGVMMKPNLPLWSSKKGIKVLSFDGSGDYAHAESWDDMWSKSSFTTSFWFNVKDDPGGGTFWIYKGGTIWTGGNPSAHFMVGDSGVISSIFQELWYVNPDASSEGTSAYTGLVMDHAGGDDTIDRSRWHHCLWRWNKDTHSGKLQTLSSGLGKSNVPYTVLDGSATGRSEDGNSAHWITSGGTPASESIRMYLGGYIADVGVTIQLSAINMELADLAFFDRYLNDSEVYALKAGVDPSEISNCLHYWSFNNSDNDTGTGTTRNITKVNAVYATPTSIGAAATRIGNL